MRASIVRLSIIAALGLTAALAGAQPADAAALDGCGDVQLSQPFLPWGDAAEYKLAPDGGLEQGGDAWSLQGGAAVVSGNEPFQVGGAGDAASLELPAGSRATTAPVCVDLDSPTVRLFVQNSGDRLSTLDVTVIVQTVLGRVTLPVGVVAGSEDWRPTAPMLLLANLTSVASLDDGTAEIQVRFTPLGDGADWRIDDVYVDPWKGR